MAADLSIPGSLVQDMPSLKLLNLAPAERPQKRMHHRLVSKTLSRRSRRLQRLSGCSGQGYARELPALEGD